MNLQNNDDKKCMLFVWKLINQKKKLPDLRPSFLYFVSPVTFSQFQPITKHVHVNKYPTYVDNMYIHTCVPCVCVLRNMYACMIA